MIELIHTSGRKLVLAITGGGSQAIAELLTVPGASGSVLEAVVPYSLPALEAWLGGSIDHACSERTARAMAMAAFERARKLSTAAPDNLRGIGVTASLATTQPKRGFHRIHVAWQSASATVAYSVELAKGERSRAEEETIAARLALHAVAEACDVTSGLLTNPSPGEPITRREKRASVEWTELLLNRREQVRVGAPATKLIFPGAFNPLHAGHHRMAEFAAARFGQAVTLELSITNVEKPPLDFIEIDERLKQLTDFPVILTRAPTFVEKAAMLPGCTFIVGADTLARIADPTYYAGSSERRDAAIQTIAGHGCRYLVFGRAVDDQFATTEKLNLPPAFLSLCDQVPEAEFRDDSSSTAIRSNR